MRDVNDDYSLVRVLHAAPNADAVDIYINDTLFFKELSFTEFSPYVYVPEGNYTMSVYPVNTTENPILSKYIEIDDDELLTIAIIGDNDNLDFLFIEEDTESTYGQNSKLRVVNLVPNSPRVNILEGENVLFPNVGYKDITRYKTVSPGTYTLNVELVENGQIVLQNQISITADRVYTLYALGNIPDVEIYQSLDGATFIRNRRR